MTCRDRDAVFASRRGSLMRDEVNGTFVHRSLLCPLFNALAILRDKTAPEGQMPLSVAREYPCGCSGFCSAPDKKGRKPKSPVPEPRPCPWPHWHTTRSAEATGSQCVTIVHCEQLQMGSCGWGASSPLQLGEAVQFPLCLSANGGTTKGAAEIQQCCKICASH